MPKNKFASVAWIAVAVFSTYVCMYAYRKPISAATYDGLQLWGYSYKVIIVITQVLGYLLSKFIGIKIISELDPKKRIFLLLGLIGTSLLSLLMFAVTPYPYNFIWIFFNGLPLGLIWGIVFSYIEGRQFTDILATFLSVSFIISSGIVKSIGRYFIETWHVSDFWMPFLVGFVFIPPLLLSAFMLSKINPPTQLDISLRQKRVTLDKDQRKQLFSAFAVGLVAILAANMLMTICRDIKDNFLVEFFQSIQIDSSSSIYAKTETFIGLFVLVMLSSLVFLKNNRKAFYLIHTIMLLGFVSMIVSTWFYVNNQLSPLLWVIVQGIGVYTSYIVFQSLYFERFIAAFKIKGNVGFLIYMSDFIGYLGSCIILILKEFSDFKANWGEFFVQMNYFVGIGGIITVLISFVYFWLKLKKGNILYEKV